MRMRQQSNMKDWESEKEMKLLWENDQILL